MYQDTLDRPAKQVSEQIYLDSSKLLKNYCLKSNVIDTFTWYHRDCVTQIDAIELEHPRAPDLLTTVRVSKLSEIVLALVNEIARRMPSSGQLLHLA